MAMIFSSETKPELPGSSAEPIFVQHKPTVFIEPIAGNSDNCCFTHGHNGWGALVEAVGGKNIGSALLPGTCATPC
jgi:ABC-type Fe3+-hydroxamate transport system substrate-binding protein